MPRGGGGGGLHWTHWRPRWSPDPSPVHSLLSKSSNATGKLVKVFIDYLEINFINFIP